MLKSYRSALAAGLLAAAAAAAAGLALTAASPAQAAPASVASQCRAELAPMKDGFEAVRTATRQEGIRIFKEQAAAIEADLDRTGDQAQYRLDAARNKVFKLAVFRGAEVSYAQAMDTYRNALSVCVKYTSA